MVEHKIIITTYPFGHVNREPIELLNSIEAKFLTNSKKRKYTREEHLQVLRESNPHIIIAGTEKYDKEALDIAKNLKLISRVGIGLDSVDLEECKKRDIIVTYTPDAPSNAVAELTICQMLNMLRKVQNVSTDMQNDKWNRYIGREIKNCTVGIIGYGRIGKILYRILDSFECKIVVHDIEWTDKLRPLPSWQKVSKNDILNHCDIISIHIPLKDEKIDNHDYITKRELYMMKENVRLLNISRGGIINEGDLYEWLKESPKATVAIDTFNEEPYRDKLANMGNAYLTPHLGSCTEQSRLDMEYGAAKAVSDYIHKQPLRNRVV